MNEEKSYGPLIALIIIVVLIIAGGTFALKKKVNNEPIMPAQNSSLEADTTEVLEDDLSTVELDTLGEEMNNIEQELLKN